MGKYLDERGDPPSATHESERKVFGPAEVRQGRFGIRVLAVLAASLVLAMVVWGAIEIWADRTDDDRRTAVEDVQSAPADDQTSSIGDGATSEENRRALAPTDRDPTYQTGTGGPSQQVTPDGTEK
ncbi:MAG TPA: hypothetical protein VD840_06820 [Sinorhizobium sp.]|nr:hypothetical protein [Sinorhizobium sp.]